ncbi:matrixin family metalloprotease [Aquibacillus salsiterrae]|uniref:Matrixin family metalloprotease n=1 Tax=Aquibacillus salsiterrae TaxID=2950439 RepID=A0A9X3WHQ8_9BACI|nr:matrixin family metalloprotease [Aquibacillus salsiterrae]MDC3418680.1 matrixin family metalloprotease [Aquibacillus salsiterrae]
MLKKIIFVVVLLIIPANQVYAYDTYNDHILNGGVGDYGNNKRYYYLTSSAVDEELKIKEAMGDWIYTTERTGITTPISIRETSFQSLSSFDFYKDQYWPVEMGVLGDTLHYRYSSQVDEEYENWGWTKVRLNGANYDINSYWVQKATIAHEMGHAMGLDHVGNTYAIMYSSADKANVNKAGVDDLNGINHLY